MVAYNRSTPINGIRSLSISGTTVTVSAEVALGGTVNTYVYLAAVTSSTMLAVSLISTTSLRTMVYTISGASDPVAGTGTTTNTANATTFIIRPISAGVRWVVIYRSTVSTVNTLLASTQEPTANCDLLVSGSKAIFLNCTQAAANVLIDTAGTASKGAELPTVSSSNAIGISATNNVARFACVTASAAFIVAYDFSGSSLTHIVVSKLSVGTNGFPALGTPPFDGTRYPAILIGTHTFCVGAQASAVGARVPRIVGNAIDAPPIKMPRYDDLSSVGGLSAAGSRSNETWGYTSASVANGGRLTRVESVT